MEVAMSVAGGPLNVIPFILQSQLWQKHSCWLLAGVISDSEWHTLFRPTVLY